MNTLDIIGAIIGLAYVVSEYRADRWFWPLCLLMSVFYIVIDFTSGLYANGSICCYNFLMSIYGILVWRGILGRKDKAERPITSCPAAYWPWIVLAVAALTVAMHWLLALLHESQYPWLDGFSAAVSIVAMWMLARKYWEQWVMWLVVNPIMAEVFWLTGNHASAALYVVFVVFCILGIIRWKKLCV